VHDEKEALPINSTEEGRQIDFNNEQLDSASLSI
jgi:hypothetical protein